MDISFSKLTIEDAIHIKDIDASQYIKRAWRSIENKKELVNLKYQSHGFPEGFDNHYERLKQTIIHGGYAMGAYHLNKLVGFVTLNNVVFGHRFKYVLLDQLFISLQYRHQGIGKKLFSYCVSQAKVWKVDKIYICAGSAEDTIVFYQSIGCHEALEINTQLYENDPRDIQLEFDIHSVSI